MAVSASEAMSSEAPAPEMRTPSNLGTDMPAINARPLGSDAAPFGALSLGVDKLNSLWPGTNANSDAPADGAMAPAPK